MSKLHNRLTALAAATVLSFSSAAIGVPVAFAQEVGAPEQPDASVDADLVDPNANVSLTINKRIGDPGATNTTPLQGVSFEIEKIEGIDLTTNDGWAALAEINAVDTGEHTITPIDTLVTDEAGQASISTGDDSAFTVGVYRVTELQLGNYTAADPFLVVLPFSDEGNWEYNQSVTPKNQEIIPSKQVDSTNATLGSDISYTINAPVPAGNLSRFIIEDPLVSGLTNNEDAVVSLAGAGEESIDPAGYSIAYDGQTMTVTFNETGRARLQELRVDNPGLKVIVEFSAELTSIPTEGETPGMVTNTANIYLPNGAEVNTDGGSDENPDADLPTSTTFGDLVITKTTDNGEESLNGAEFEVYQCTNQDDVLTLVGEALTVATTDTGTPDTTLVTDGGDDNGGNATANGYAIPIQSYAADTGAVTPTYCVLETVAPDGYVRNPEPQLVSVDYETRAMTVEVENQRNTIAGNLPATGAWGIALVFLVGLALLARGIYTSYADRA